MSQYNKRQLSEEGRFLYDLLGIEKDATKDNIRTAFRKKALQCHPDKHPGDAEKAEQFKVINKASSVLMDDERREIYDSYGSAGLDVPDQIGVKQVDTRSSSASDAATEAGTPFGWRFFPSRNQDRPPDQHSYGSDHDGDSIRRANPFIRCLMGCLYCLTCGHCCYRCGQLCQQCCQQRSDWRKVSSETSRGSSASAATTAAPAAAAATNTGSLSGSGSSASVYRPGGFTRQPTQRMSSMGAAVEEDLNSFWNRYFEAGSRAAYY